MTQTQLPTPHPGTTSPTAPGTDLMAVLGLVFAFVFSPLGIVFSAVGLHSTRRDGTRGRGLAVAGLVLSVLGTVAVGWFLLQPTSGS